MEAPRPNPNTDLEVAAEVIPTEDGLSIIFSVTGSMESRVRQMFNVINDQGDVSVSMAHVLRIAADAVDLIEENRPRQVTLPENDDNLGEKLTAAFQKAVTEAIAEHHAAGRSVVGMKNGKIIETHPDGTTSEIPPRVAGNRIFHIFKSVSAFVRRHKDRLY